MAAALLRGGALAPQLQAALHAVKHACKLGRSVQGSLRAADKLVKQDTSPVTTADFGIQALVVLSLQAQLGRESFRLVAEEDTDGLSGSLLERVTAEVNAALPKDVSNDSVAWTNEDVLAAVGCGNYDGDPSKPYWVLDPIDGTKGFVRGDQYAVGLAYLVDGVPRIGVVGCPNLPCPHGIDRSAAKAMGGTLFSAVADQGAVQHAVDGSFEAAIAVAPPASTSQFVMCESFEKAHSSHSTSAQVIKALGVSTDPVRIDSMGKYCLLARGDASLYLRLATKPGRVEKVWDHAAGFVVAQEAGATITDSSGKPLDFAQGRTLKNNKGVIVSSAFHTDVISALATVRGGADAAPTDTASAAGGGGSDASGNAGAGGARHAGSAGAGAGGDAGAGAEASRTARL